MIIVKLKGGLGNQMFQYAFGRVLSMQRNEPLKLDASDYPDARGRTYRLGCFNIIAELASPAEAYRSKWQLPPLWRRLICRFLGRACQPSALSPGYVKCENPYYVSGMLEESGNYYDGYWQSYKYWAGYEDLIRRELSFKVAMSEESRELAEKINACNAVSVHFRRGDYVADATATAYHGGCSLEYYVAAVRRIAEVEKNIELFIFSDEPDWCRENFKPEYPVHFITHTASELDYEDIGLMSCCKHNIIANSSFSWWGAWLNPNPGKWVICPATWVATPEVNILSQSLLPEEWIRI